MPWKCWVPSLLCFFCLCFSHDSFITLNKFRICNIQKLTSSHIAFPYFLWKVSMSIILPALFCCPKYSHSQINHGKMSLPQEHAGSQGTGFPKPTRCQPCSVLLCRALHRTWTTGFPMEQPMHLNSDFPPQARQMSCSEHRGDFCNSYRTLKRCVGK